MFEWWHVRCTKQKLYPAASDPDLQQPSLLIDVQMLYCVQQFYEQNLSKQ